MALALDVIQPHSTWDILDPSKLTTYMSCPRKYFYTYVLGWQSDYPNNHLVFGSSWHIAVEHLLRNGYTSDALAEAKIMFMQAYRSEFPPSSDELYLPKDPANALRALNDYAKRFTQDVREYEVLYTEIGGLVLVSDERTMAFKMDAVLRNRNDGDIVGLDHKSSQRRYSNWGDHWTISTQMLTYLHVLHCLYPESEFTRMLVRCTFFYKAQPNAFEEHPIEKSLEQLQAFIDRQNRWLGALDMDMEMLTTEESTEQPTMQAFPQNDTACFNYGQQCRFFEFCNAWSNPLTRCESVPLGFKREYWDPLHQPEVRTLVNLATQSGEPVQMHLGGAHD